MCVLPYRSPFTIYILWYFVGSTRTNWLINEKKNTRPYVCSLLWLISDIALSRATQKDVKGKLCLSLQLDLDTYKHTWFKFKIGTSCVYVWFALWVAFYNLYLEIFCRVFPNELTMFKKNTKRAECLFLFLAPLNDCSFTSDSKCFEIWSMSVFSPPRLLSFRICLMLDQSRDSNGVCLFSSLGRSSVNSF